MYSSLATLAWAVFSASQAMASCAHGTHLHRRAEGAVEVSNFGYIGLTVCVTCTPRHTQDWFVETTNNST